MIIKWSPISAARLSEIVNYISEDNPNAACKFAANIFSSVEKLINFPNSGRIIPELGNIKYREVLVSNYRIIYLLLQSLSVYLPEHVITVAKVHKSNI